jgi:NADH-quinone oxidoreductase subunit H
MLYILNFNSTNPMLSILNILFLLNVLICLLSVIALLIAVAFYTLAERKLMASVQRRRGPDVVGFIGFLQPIADGVKLILKEPLIPSRANVFIFVFAPFMVFVLSVVGWSVIPFSSAGPVSDANFSVLVVFAVSSLSVFGLIMAGWASNSKYAFIGALRSTAQMISYEISIGFIFINVALCAGSINFTEIVFAQEHVWFVWPLWPIALIFLVSILAETNRVPFDLIEAEAEIVAGYNVEYSGTMFALFFLGEYSNMLLMSAVTILLFFGGWLPPAVFLTFIPEIMIFSFKLAILSYFFIIVRSALPRVRFDQLMSLGWSFFLPFTFLHIFFTSFVLYGLGTVSYYPFDWLKLI